MTVRPPPPDPPDGAAGTRDLDRGQRRVAGADALEHRVDAVAVGQLLDPLDGLGAAFADHVGGAELARERDPVGVPA